MVNMLARSTKSATAKQKRPPRSEGRPRLDAPAAILSEDRRSQIRRAQKTYRLKKEASIQESQQRAAHLERKMTIIEKSLQNYRVILQSQLQDTHPKLLGEFDCILSLLASAPEDVSQGFSTDGVSPRETLEQSITESPNQIQNGDVISNNITVTEQVLMGSSFKSNDVSTAANISTSFQKNGDNITNNRSDLVQRGMEINGEQSTVQAVDRSIGANVSYTYSFLENSFTRRLKRSSLEHAFRIFSDPHSNPHEVFRLFRLVPCFRERAKMYPYFKDLVTSDREHSLEISALPFYTIGGAGTHYPDTNEAGDPIYPPNMRLPRRILGILRTCEEPRDSNDANESQQSHLELCGFGGDWFDCRDVEGYLRENGVNIDGSTGFPTVNISQTDSEISASSQQTSRCVLDLDSFLEKLHGGVAILGRAPGFRRSDVEIAFRSALQMLV